MTFLRPYQLDAIAKLRRVAAQGTRRICMVMPTGAGKTRTCATIAESAVSKGGRVLWLAHRGELVDQAVAALADAGVEAGAISASAASEPKPFARVQVATVQTLLRRGQRPDASLIVADEAHHYPAETFFALLAGYPDATLIGPTATPERADGIGLGAVFRQIVVGVRVRELVADGYLVPAHLVAPARKLRVGEAAQRPVDAYLEHARGRRAVVFSPCVALAAQHAEGFRATGLFATVVTGETPWGERRAAFDALRAGALHALVNVYVATEGLDVPELDCVILARGIGSAGGYLQMVGRALRPASGKVDALILDLTGCSHVHGHPEDDRQYSLEGRGIRRADELPTVDQAYCRVCGAPIVPGEVCADCGTGPREIDQRITGDRLVKYERKRAETEDQRIATLRRWMADGKARGYKPTWAAAKFKAVYGSWPSREIQAAAVAQLAATEAA